MPFYFRKSVRLGRSAGLNVSKRGLSLSKRVGPATVNSRGRLSFRLGNGLYWRNK